MNWGGDNVMTENTEKLEVLNIIFARDQKINGIVSIDLPKANCVLVQPGHLSC